MPIDPNAPLNPKHYLILLLLAEEPTFGVQLLERIDDRSDGTVRFNAGSLYRTIAQLVEQNWVEPRGEEAPSEGVGAPRKIYGVTAEGIAALRAEALRQSSMLEAVRALGLDEA